MLSSLFSYNFHRVVKLHVVLQKSVVHEEDEGTAEGDADIHEDGGYVNTEFTFRAGDLGVIQYQVEYVHV